MSKAPRIVRILKNLEEMKWSISPPTPR
jgi:hypothetical protein